MNLNKRLAKVGSYWNAIRYSIYIPIYDLVAMPFARLRAESINQYKWRGSEQVLILGAGSGLDFKHLPVVKKVNAIDISPGMLLLMKIRAAKKVFISPQLMDGQNLKFSNNSFDVIILHLILAVIPDPVIALKEVERVLKPGGTVLIMDKFSESPTPSLMRSTVNILTSFLATSITRNVEELVSHTSLVMKQKKPAAIAGLFKFVVLEKSKN